MNHSTTTMKRWSLVAGSMAVATALAFAPVASATSSNAKAKTCKSGAGTKVSGPACEGLAFYKGQTVTFDAATVGGGFDTTARALAPALQQYLGATVNVVNYAGGGGIPPQNAANGAPPTGLTLGFLFPLSDVLGTLTNTPSVNFNAKHVAFVAGTGPSFQVIVGSPTSSVTTFAALSKAGAPVSVLTEGSGTTYDTLLLLDALFKLNVHPLTGYASVAGVLEGFIRGDGPAAIGSLSNFGPSIAAGKAKVLTTTTKVPPGMAFRQYLLGAPTFAQLLNKLPAKTKVQKTEKTAFADLIAATGQPIFTQQKVPTDRLDALRDAVAWAYKQSSVKAKLEFSGDSPVYVTPQVAKGQYDNSLVIGKSLASLIVSHF